MKTKLFLIAGTILSLHLQLNAQTTSKLQDPSNSFIANKALDIDAGGGVIYFKDHELLQGQLFTQYFSNTGLGAYDSMHLVETTHDSILADENSPAPNLTHNLYQQYYKGVPVEGALYTEHYEAIDGNVLSTSGFVVENLNLSVTPQVSESEALNLIRTDLNFESYEWDSTGFYPKGELIIIASPTQENTYLLAWKFPIHLSIPFYAQDVFVNATNGQIERKTPLTCGGGIFNHYFYGAKSDLDTKRDIGWFSDDFYLFANDDTRNIYTTDDRLTVQFTKATWEWRNMPANSSTDNWGFAHYAATSTHYAVQKAWDFYKQSFPNRNGMTGWGRHLRVHADWDWTQVLTQNPGPFYVNDVTKNEDYIIMTRTNSNTFLFAYDIVAHEFTHGVIRNSRALASIKVPGAINESFADIFGMVAERYTKGGVYNWTIGEDALLVRNLQTPNAYGHPSYYLEANRWIDPTNPALSSDGGAHTNLGVQNKWFYLLSMGGSQPIYINSVLQPTRTVSGIGIDKAARIAYYAMINFVNSGGEKDLTFNAVRASTINAAKILYGYCSNEYIQTCRAWYAVNVGFNCDPCLTAAPNWFSRNFPYQQPNDFNGTGLAERENKVAKMKVFPNPASDKIKVMVEEVNTDLGDNNYTINILTVDGKLVLTNIYNTIENLEINIENLQAGVYFINISNSKWTKNNKFVKH